MGNTKGSLVPKMGHTVKRMLPISKVLVKLIIHTYHVVSAL